jgi:hypothetical protein
MTTLRHHFSASLANHPIIEVELLEKAQLRAVHSSAKRVLKGKRKGPKATLVLLPMERLGAEQGKSGSRVMVAYFKSPGTDEEGRPILRPMVLKLSRAGKFGELKTEERRAGFIEKLAVEKDHFAIPEYFHRENGAEYGVLWSPFAFEGILFTGDAPQLEIQDFHRRLTDVATHVPGPTPNQTKKLAQTLDKVFSFLTPVHKGKLSKPRPLVSEYVKYIRRLEAKNSWGQKWREVWPDSKPTVRYKNRERTNPLWVLERLKALKPIPLFCGVVHGDLHPRNIVFAGDAPYLIDFGWTAKNKHIAKDFALLECNFRFMVLPADVPFEDVEHMATWIRFGDDPPPFGPRADCLLATELIRTLRKRAKLVFPNDTDWDYEYVVPLFLVAMGLLKHLRTADNQMSAILTVLSLADYIKNKSSIAKHFSVL